jgi:hypothetical protein
MDDAHFDDFVPADFGRLIDLFLPQGTSGNKDSLWQTPVVGLIKKVKRY